MSELITVPTFTFQQGKNSDGTFAENPIQVSFYNGTINLSQEGQFMENDSINISTAHFEKLFKEIKKHYPEAKSYLEKK